VACTTCAAGGRGSRARTSGRATGAQRWRRRHRWWRGLQQPNHRLAFQQPLRYNRTWPAFPVGSARYPAGDVSPPGRRFSLAPSAEWRCASAKRQTCRSRPLWLGAVPRTPPTEPRAFASLRPTRHGNPAPAHRRASARFVGHDRTADGYRYNADSRLRARAPGLDRDPWLRHSASGLRAVFVR